MFNRGEKRGQVTLFIIIAIIIVILGVLLFLFWDTISLSFGFGLQDPNQFMEKCIKEDLQKNLEIISTQGGYMSPPHYFMYRDDMFSYLIYTNEYYKLGVVQEPFLKKHIEEELFASVQEKAMRCFEELKEKYRKAGYSVNQGDGEARVELLPKRVILEFNYPLTMTKGEERNIFGGSSGKTISVVLHNNIYELIGIASSIINAEAVYGDAETKYYMLYYHDLKVEKKKQSEGTTLYMISDINNGNKFQFATRSLAWPPGYGLAEMLANE